MPERGTAERDDGRKRTRTSRVARAETEGIVNRVPFQEQDRIQATFDRLSQAWQRADGAGFAAACTDDVEFINLLGMHVTGRAAVAQLHATIFHGPYANSTVAFTIDHLRQTSADSVLVIAPSRLDIPAGPVKGTVLSIASVLLVRDGERWAVAHFHNTRREASAADHTQVMREAIERPKTPA